MLIALGWALALVLALLAASRMPVKPFRGDWAVYFVLLLIVLYVLVVRRGEVLYS